MSAATLPPGDVGSVLEQSRTLTWPVLRAAVGRLAPQMQRVAGYHFGWLAPDGTELDSDGGKGLRPALAILSARAVGAPDEIAVPGAVAVELVHNFSLLHDDLMDGDEERHHRATAWTVFGSSDAILGGVALLTLAEQILLDLQTPAGAAATRLLTGATSRLVTGQTEDLDFESRTDVGLDECLAMAGNKTAALFSASAAIGAVLAGADPRTIDALAQFGEHLGCAFQLVDDLLGIWGAPEVTGKPVLADLRAGKKSLPVVAALRAGGPDSARLADLIEHADIARDDIPGDSGSGHSGSGHSGSGHSGSGHSGSGHSGSGRRRAPIGADDDRYAAMAELIERAGGRSWVRAEAERQLAIACAILADASPPERVLRDLTDVASFVVGREL
ncbi:MAG: polyprenyl synthetase family protein [Mycobacteriales bacterium]|nr:MAG: dimethylallyltranstransferase [Pseudonocardiales bacterium]